MSLPRRTYHQISHAAGEVIEQLALRYPLSLADIAAHYRTAITRVANLPPAQSHVPPLPCLLQAVPVEGTDGWTIILPRDLGPEQERFVVCHTLGHIVRGHFEGRTDAPISDDEALALEEEADFFAVQMVAPPALVAVPSWERAEVARDFEVSEAQASVIVDGARKRAALPKPLAEEEAALIARQLGVDPSAAWADASAQVGVTSER